MAGNIKVKWREILGLKKLPSKCARTTLDTTTRERERERERERVIS